jgi:hypothetical protein
MCSTGSIASGLSSVAIVISIVSGHSALEYVIGVPHCSQNCRRTGGDDAWERKAPVMTRNDSRGTVAHATTCEPDARRHDSQ